MVETVSRRHVLASASAAAGSAMLAAPALASIPEPQGDPEFAAKLAAYRRAEEATRQADAEAERASYDLKEILPGDDAAREAWMEAEEGIWGKLGDYLEEQDYCALALILHPASTVRELREKLEVALTCEWLGREQISEPCKAVFADALRLAGKG